MRHKKWLIPIGHAALALVFVGGGLAWGVVTGVAIPDQDPTPAMREYARFHMRIVDGLLLAGGLAFVVALASVPALWAAAVLRKRRAV